MTPDPLEARLRRLGAAVAAQTTADGRELDLTDTLVVAPPPRHGPAGAAIAAAVVAVVVLAAVIGIAAVRRGEPGSVTVGGPPPTAADLVPSSLPRLVPSFLPAGNVLNTASIGDGRAQAPVWMRRFDAPSTGSTPAGAVLRVVPASVVDAYFPLESPGLTSTDYLDMRRTSTAGGSRSVDIDGRPGAIATTSVLVPPQHAPQDTGQTGYVVSWTDRSGNLVELSSTGLTAEQATTIARSVRPGGTAAEPTADIDRATLPAGLVETYAGPDYSTLDNVSPSSASGPSDVHLTYRDLSPAKNPAPSSQLSLSISLSEHPLPAGGDPSAWLRRLEPNAETFSSNGMSFVLRPPLDSGSPMQIVGIGPDSLVLISAYKQTADEMRQMATSLQTVSPADWAAYLASAATLPYPPKVEQPADALLCSRLRFTSTSHPSALGGASEVADRARSLVTDAPPALDNELVTIATGLDKAARGATPSARVFEHDDIVALRSAVREVLDWIRDHCSSDAGKSPSNIDDLVAFLPSLSDQDPDLDQFCRQYQTIHASVTDATDYPSRAAQLDRLLPLIPPSHSDVRSTATELRDRWREVPEGQRPQLRDNDPIVADPAVIGRSCPDWPL